MPQDRESGAAAGIYGFETAKAIAQKVGAKKERRKNSNEYLLKGKHIVIKCAHLGNDSVGVSWHMLKGLDSIYGAFETDKGTYEIYELSPARFKMNARETASQGPSRGRVGIVKKTVFKEKGKFLEALNLE